MQKKHQKTEQLQIRVSTAQKRTIKKRAQAAEMTMSEWLLSKVIPSSQMAFQDLVEEIAVSSEPSYAFAELLELLESMNREEFEQAVSEPPKPMLSPYWENYLAATIEQAAASKHARTPDWTRSIAPLEAPVFGSELKSLRLHLLLNSPPAFVRRNIFVDAVVGARV